MVRLINTTEDMDKARVDWHPTLFFTVEVNTVVDPFLNLLYLSLNLPILQPINTEIGIITPPSLSWIDRLQKQVGTRLLHGKMMKYSDVLTIYLAWIINFMVSPHDLQGYHHKGAASYVRQLYVACTHDKKQQCTFETQWKGQQNCQMLFYFHACQMSADIWETCTNKCYSDKGKLCGTVKIPCSLHETVLFSKKNMKQK